MPACLSPDEHHRRAAAVGIEWLEDPAGAMTPTPARCLTCGYGADGTWKTRSNDVQRGKGCPACAGILPITPEEHARRAAAVGIAWLEDPPNNSTPTPARCLTCSYGADGTWTPRSSNVRRGHGCPACAGVALLTPEEHRRRAALVGIEWLADPANNRTPTPARCLTCGYEWKPWPSHVSMGKGCPACAGILPITHEEHARRAALVGIEWLAVPAHALAPTPARCLTCGYGADGTWKTRSNDVQRGKGCPACAGILPLTAEEYDRRAALVGIAWLEKPTNSRGPAPARCLTCGYGEDGTWKPWTNAVYRGQGCPVCADYGFDPAAPAILYVLVNDARAAAKFGITKDEETRLGAHRRQGFDRLALRVEYAHGYLAREDEERVREAVLRVSPAAVARGREYVDLDVVPEADLLALVEAVVIDGDAGGVIIR